jgi:archaellum component FlaC
MSKALGKKLGEVAKRMTELSNEMNDLNVTSGNKDQQAQNAEKMNQLNAELQGQSRLYKILSDSVSTVLKSIGDGMDNLSRKQ